MEEKYHRLWDSTHNNLTLYKHDEIRHKKCLTPLELKYLGYEKKRKNRKKKDRDDSTANLDKIYY